MTTNGELLLRVAERMRYRCETCGGTGHNLSGYVQPCPACRDGWVYPLQAECPRREELRQQAGESAVHYWHDVGLQGPHYKNDQCEQCSGRGWVLVALGPYTLEAAAARCGYAVEIQSRRRQAVAVWNPTLPGGMSRNGRSKWYDYSSEDAESILGAAIAALDEVLAQVEGGRDGA